MLDDLAFLEVIRQSPSDDGPRLIYADFLEEKGDPASLARAEFIRLQCLLARGIPESSLRNAALRREKDLQELHWRVWIRPVCQALGEPVPMPPPTDDGRKKPRRAADSFEQTARQERYFLKRVMENGPYSHVIEQYWGQGRDVPYLHSVQFRRGFVSHVSLAAKTYRNATHVARMMERAPLESLALVGWNPSQFTAMADMVEVSRLRTLELVFSDSEVVRRTAFRPEFAGLERLLIRQSHGDVEVGEALLAGRELAGLRHVQFRECHFTTMGFEQFVHSPGASRLETLGFPDCSGLEDRALSHFLEVGDWPALKSLDLSGASMSLTMRQLLAGRFAGRLVFDHPGAHWPEHFQFG